MKKKRTGTSPTNGRNTLQVDGSRAKEPLCECVRGAVDGYFSALAGHEVRGVFDLVMSEVERPLFESVLEHTGGNQSKAAEVLGINRGTLRKKLRQYQLL